MSYWSLVAETFYFRDEIKENNKAEGVDYHIKGEVVRTNLPPKAERDIILESFREAGQSQYFKFVYFMKL